MNASIVMIYGDRCYDCLIEKGDTITIGSNKKDNIKVDSFLPEQIVIKWKNSGFSVNARKEYSFEQNKIPLDTMIVLGEGTDNVVALFFGSVVSQSETKYKLPYNCLLRVGWLDDNDIVIKMPFVSKSHFILKNESGVVRVEDCDSTNGLFLNGKRISVAKMRSGDVLSILSVKITLLNGELLFENVGDALTVQNIDHSSSAIMELHGSDDMPRLLYRRSPRMQEKLPSEDIVLASAPSKGQKYEKSRGMFSSLVGTGAMMAASIVTTAASPALLAARAASLVSPLTHVAVNGGGNRKRKKNLEEYEAMRREKYGAYIDDQKARIESVATVQRDILTRENPTPNECMEILFGLQRNLWERTPSDRDFLDVRLGMGYEDLCVNVKGHDEAGSFQMENDEIRELSEQIIEETRIVDNVPARVSLIENNTVGFVGDRSDVIWLLKNMLVSLTTAHCFEDLRIAGIFDENEEEQWQFLKWFPHVWDSEKKSRYLAFHQKEAHGICEMFSEIVKGRRAESAEDHSQEKSIPKPYYILILGSKNMVEKEQVMNELFDNDPSMGVTTLFLFDDVYSLPLKCRYIIDMDNGPCAFVRNEANNRIYFTMDPELDDGLMDSFARRMSAVELEGFSTMEGIPNSITFLEGYGVKRVEQLPILQNWNSATPYESLAAPIGVLAGGRTFSLDIHEKMHGPHGLVAGTTGSGKSEILQTWILSMALTFHPYDVVFVIIDYKGGGMANLLEKLPHVVGKITNIGSNIGRSLISLKSEIDRRQRIFDAYGVNHIDKYQKLYKSGKAEKPLPHLIIVADEFAELKKEEPEFMKGLVSASRVGRSLGIHLVLATQKPGGVVDDQIQSNSRFRLCLKVQTAGDSREMIKRLDAAKITQSGRSFVLVGEDEYFDMFQSYYSGAPYDDDPVSKNEDENVEINLVETNGRRVCLLERPEKKKVKSDLDELTAIREYVCKVAKENGIEKLPGPWLPDLPETLTVRELIKGGFDGNEWHGKQKWFQVPVGMYDLPVAQAQGVQYLNFTEDGHYGIYGAPGTGKTTFLKSLLVSIGLYYKPEDVNVYILDLGGWGLNVFSSMPHVGGVALDGEDEKFAKLEQMIRGEFEERKRIFLKNGVNSLQTYREGVAEDIPAIVIVIDNILSVFEQYPDLEPFLSLVARDGATYGIYMVYTANTTSGIRYKVLQNIRGAVTFELTEKSDYAGIVGRLEGMVLPKIAGRAFFKGNPPLEFQAALFAEGEIEKDRSQNLKVLLQSMNDKWRGKRPNAIPVMPERLCFQELKDNYQLRTKLPIGLQYENLGIATTDLKSRYCMLISGQSIDEIGQLLCGYAGIMNSIDDVRLFVIDSSKQRLASLKDCSKIYGLVSENAKMDELFTDLVTILNQRMTNYRAAKEKAEKEGVEFNEESLMVSSELCCIVIDDLSEFVSDNHGISERNQKVFERISRIAKGLGVCILAAINDSNLEMLRNKDAIVLNLVNHQNAIAVEGSPSQYPAFQSDLKFLDKSVEAGKGNGYFFFAGKCKKIKLPEGKN